MLREKETPRKCVNGHNRTDTSISNTLQSSAALLKHQGLVLREMLSSGRKGTCMQPRCCCGSRPCWLVPVQPNTEQNTVFFIKRKIRSWHCSRWAPEVFQGQMKRPMSPSWEPPSIYCQDRQPGQGRGCVMIKGSSRSLYCTPKPAPGRTSTCLQLDLAPFQRVNRMQIKSSIPKSMANR